jgi:dienelactone hydrolase
MQWNRQIVVPPRKVVLVRCLVGLTALALLTIVASSRASKAPMTVGASGEPAQPAPIKTATDTFPLASKSIRVERFEPATPGKCPAVILVHAVDGLEAFGWLYRQQASKYAGEGYVVLLVHYFDRTRGTKENLKTLKESFRLFFDTKAVKHPNDVLVMRQHFTAWVETIRQAVRYAAALPRVDSRRIGLAGFSLGAALALAAAGEEEPKGRQIATVVALFGCLPPDMREGIRGLPPTLMIQGDVDERVPPRAAYDFETWLNRKKLPVRSRCISGSATPSTGPDATSSWKPRAKSRSSSGFRLTLATPRKLHGMLRLRDRTRARHRRQ